MPSTSELMNMIQSIKQLKNLQSIPKGQLAFMVDEITNKATTQIINKLGGYDGTSAAYFNDIHDLMSSYVKQVIYGTPMNVEVLRGIMSNLYITYLFRKAITFIMASEIPIVSGVVGALRTTQIACSNADELKQLLIDMDLSGISKYLDMTYYVCSQIYVVTNADSYVSFWLKGNTSNFTTLGINTFNYIFNSLTYTFNKGIEISKNLIKNPSQNLSITNSGGGGGGGWVRDGIVIEPLLKNKYYKKYINHIKKTKRKSKKNEKRNTFTNINKYKY